MYQYVRLWMSPDGLALLKEWEGCKLKAYLDTGGVWTIGYGHTATAHRGMEITQLRAEELLLQYDLPQYEEAVNKYVTVALSQRQFDALVVFCYNIGVNAFKDSTLVKVLNKGWYGEVQEQFMRWVYDNKKRIEGLANRREAEAKLFNRGIFNGPPS